ncbi:MAG TPA: hypothetical protein VFZ97_12795 [Acidimicrobiales bacterium]
MRFQLWHVPLRLATGAYILNSGVNKWNADDEEVHKGIHWMASTAYPQVEPVDPKTFTKALAGAEIALGTALLTPVISPGLAGAALTAFSGGLVGLYARTPSMREDGSLRPSHSGSAVAKDVWLLGIGLALVIDAATSRARKLLPRRNSTG